MEFALHTQLALSLSLFPKRWKTLSDASAGMCCYFEKGSPKDQVTAKYNMEPDITGNSCIPTSTFQISTHVPMHGELIFLDHHMVIFNTELFSLWIQLYILGIYNNKIQLLWNGKAQCDSKVNQQQYPNMSLENIATLYWQQHWIQTADYRAEVDLDLQGGIYTAHFVNQRPYFRNIFLCFLL